MRIEVLGACVLGAALTLGAGSAAVPHSAPQKKDKPTASKNLLRKDLLTPKQGEFVMPKRNMFSMMTYEQNRDAAVLVDLPAQPGQPQEKAPEIREVFNFRYIGYVKSERGVTAIVILDGLPYPASEGDVLGLGIKILKITPVNIEIQGADSVKKTYSLEGERE